MAERKRPLRTYTVLEEVRAFHVYEVEAHNKQEAVELVKAGEWEMVSTAEHEATGKYEAQPHA